jgi:hypothetical protein
MISKALDSAAVINERWEAGTKTGQTRTIMLLGQTCFVNGLLDERIRTQMSVFMDTQPTMKETVDKALICETNVKSRAIQPQVQNRFNKIGNYKFQQNKYMFPQLLI